MHSSGDNESFFGSYWINFLFHVLNIKSSGTSLLIACCFLDHLEDKKSSLPGEMRYVFFSYPISCPSILILYVCVFVTLLYLYLTPQGPRFSLECIFGGLSESSGRAVKAACQAVTYSMNPGGHQGPDLT